MVTRSTLDVDEPSDEVSGSAISWGAILGGAVTAFAVSLFLSTLGAGIGLTTVSPWEGWLQAAGTFTLITGIWMIVVQWIASAFGGYVAGRLRTKWVNIRDNEVRFRDSAHGFLSWAVATTVTVMLVAGAVSSVVGSIASGATQVAAGAAQGATQGATSAATNAASGTAPLSYLVDRAFRTGAADGASAATASPNPAAEVMTILAYDIARGDVPAEDRTYMAQLIAARTGVSQAEALARVDDLVLRARSVQAQATEAADNARQGAALSSIFVSIALLIGAFIACIAAAMGGRARDLS